ncbi:MAG: hypothetical protein NPIRA04_26370 [Nitrospirales bacterium]|nr:MAG: hypothetical protein NPIRA04_26370 [Nitrospirales bacterium]
MNLVSRTRILLIICLITTVGCTPKVIKMDQATQESLSKVHQMTAIHYESNDFEVPHHYLKYMFGVISAAIATGVAHSEAEDVVARFHLQDPIMQVKEGFLSKFSQKFSNVKLSQISEAFTDDDINELKDGFGNQKVFDFQTVSWGIVRAKHDFSTPPAFQTGRNVKYSARARLLDVNEEKVLWQGVCDLLDEVNFGEAHLEESVPDSKENFLKKKFETLANRCIHELIKQFSDTEMPT